MNAGEIIQRWHQFSDGGHNKLFICLNDATDKDPAVLVITTSTIKDWRRDKTGCYHHQFETYYAIEPNQTDWFDRLTFVCLDKRWLLSMMDLLKEALTNKNYESKAKLNEQTLNAIIKCFDSSPDIDQMTKDIVQASRKARQQAKQTKPASETK